jgi:hypothetical protein
MSWAFLVKNLGMSLPVIQMPLAFIWAGSLPRTGFRSLPLETQRGSRVDGWENLKPGEVFEVAARALGIHRIWKPWPSMGTVSEAWTRMRAVMKRAGKGMEAPMGGRGAGEKESPPAWYAGVIVRRSGPRPALTQGRK